jgi:hypothetical protein
MNTRIILTIVFLLLFVFPVSDTLVASKTRSSRTTIAFCPVVLGGWRTCGGLSTETSVTAAQLPVRWDVTQRSRIAGFGVRPQTKGLPDSTRVRHAALVLLSASTRGRDGSAEGNSSIIDGSSGARKRNVPSEGKIKISALGGKKNTTTAVTTARRSNASATTKSYSASKGVGSAESAGVFSVRSLYGGELGPIEALIMGKIIIDEFVLRKQPEAKVVRTGLGGGSPQAALGARLWGARTGLVAPVGQGFAQEMLSPLEMAGVDTRGVSRLKGYVTPHTQIRYEAERMIWTPGEGWDRWVELGREILPIPENYKNASLLHVITEGTVASMHGYYLLQAFQCLPFNFGFSPSLRPTY